MSLEIKTRIRNRLKAKNYEDHWIDGILMNAGDESSFNPNAVGDNGNAYGLWQHNGPRKAALQKYAADNGQDPNNIDPETQADFLDYELNGPEREAFEALKTTKNKGEAADVILRKYERPAEQNVATRSAKYLGAPTEPQAAYDADASEPDVAVGGVQGNPYASSSAMALTETQSAEPEEPKKPKSGLAKFYEEKLPWITDDRADMLLAIGAGLLSGDDWTSGFANASANMLGLSTQQKEEATQLAASKSAEERWKAEQMLTQTRHDDTLRQREVLAKLEQDGATERQRIAAAGTQEAANAKAAAEAATAKAEEDKLTAAGYSRQPKDGQRAFYGATAYDANGQPVFEFKREGDGKTFRQSQALANGYRNNVELYQQYGPEKMSSVGTIVQQEIEKSILSNGSISMAAARDSVLKNIGNDPVSRQIADAQFNAVETKLNAMTGAAYSLEQKAGVASRYVVLPGDNDDRIRQKFSNIGNDALDESASLPVGRDYIGAIVEGTYKPTRVQIDPYKPSQQAANPNSTATAQQPPTTAQSVQPDTQQRIQENVDAQTAQARETARVQTGYPDKVKAAGITPEEWYDMALLADNPKSGITWADIMKEYGLTEDDIAAAAMRESQ